MRAPSTTDRPLIVDQHSHHPMPWRCYQNQSRTDQHLAGPRMGSLADEAVTIGPKPQMKSAELTGERNSNSLMSPTPSNVGNKR